MTRRYEIASISDEEIEAEERRVFFLERTADSDEALLDAYSQTVIGVAERVSLRTSTLKFAVNVTTGGPGGSDTHKRRVGAVPASSSRRTAPFSPAVTWRMAQPGSRSPCRTAVNMKRSPSAMTWTRTWR
jgi:hypothetical protein